MRTLVSGGWGQLGRAIRRRCLKRTWDVVALDRRKLDICNPRMVERQLGALRPDLVINAAAYTAVDKAESEPEVAFAINRDGAGILARACKHAGITLLHVSTDYVFDGSASEPYTEETPIAPLGVYGRSKAAGEVQVREAGGKVIRTSWLFEEKGPSFVHTMLRLAAEREVLRVVDDQVGCPTWADDLAEALLDISTSSDRASTYHFCGDGITSWYEFAAEIVSEAKRHSRLRCERVEPIKTSEYPTPAKRPMYSVLDTTRIRSLGITPPSWRLGMQHVIAQVIAR